MGNHCFGIGSRSGIAAAIYVNGSANYLNRDKQSVSQEDTYSNNKNDPTLAQSGNPGKSSKVTADEASKFLEKIGAGAQNEYQKRWDEISTDPRRFIAKCSTDDDSKTMIDLGGTPKAETIKAARIIVFCSWMN